MVRYFDDYPNCHLHEVILRERNLDKEQEFRPESEIVNGTFGGESLHSSEWHREESKKEERNEKFGMDLLKFLSPAKGPLV